MKNKQNNHAYLEERQCYLQVRKMIIALVVLLVEFFEYVYKDSVAVESNRTCIEECPPYWAKDMGTIKFSGMLTCSGPNPIH